MEDIRVITLHELLYSSGFVYQSCKQTEEEAQEFVTSLKNNHPTLQCFILKDYAGYDIFKNGAKREKYLYKVLSRDLTFYDEIVDRVDTVSL